MNPSSPSVFIIDDDASIDSAFRRLLNSHGYRVRTFVCAEDFLNEPPSDDPGCLLLDVSMKVVDGLTLQQAVAKSVRKYPVIFLTANADVHICATAMKMGAVDYLLKPCVTADLLEAVDRAIRLDLTVRANWARRSDAERRIATLTPREREVMALVVSGYMNKQIAFQLGCSVRTVKVHRGRMMAKMQIPSVAELVWMSAQIRAPEQPTIARERAAVPRGPFQLMGQLAV